MKLKPVLCCDGPLNGQYIYLPCVQVGIEYFNPDWENSYYELVEWPITEEIVAYWRNMNNLDQRYNESGFLGPLSLKDLRKITHDDCNIEHQRTWKRIRYLNEEITKARDEACVWGDLYDSMDAYRIDVAGDLPATLFDKYQKILNKPITYINTKETIHV